MAAAAEEHSDELTALLSWRVEEEGEMGGLGLPKRVSELVVLGKMLPFAADRFTGFGGIIGFIGILMSSWVNSGNVMEVVFIGGGAVLVVVVVMRSGIWP